MLIIYSEMEEVLEKFIVREPESPFKSPVSRYYEALITFCTSDPFRSTPRAPVLKVDRKGGHEVTFIYTQRKKKYAQSSLVPFWRPCRAGYLGPYSFLAWAHLKRQPLLAEPLSQLHNRRPRRKVHLTSQIHNSLTFVSR